VTRNPQYRRFDSCLVYFPWQGVFALPVAVMGRALGIYWFMELNMGHLILQRKAGERIAIGDDIVLSVVEIKGNRVRIAITAPNDIRVHREEIYNKIKES
jgi:carbon storage regulator